MPRMDGTGPAGMGPMTGRGRGRCNPGSTLSANPRAGAYANRPYTTVRPSLFGRFRTLFGRGQGGRGGGRGRRW